MLHSRSALLLDASAQLLIEACNVRLFQEIRTGSLSEVVFANYLQIEQDFVTTACRLHGMAVWDAPTPQAIHTHATALHHVVTDQADYFAATRRSWPVAGRLSDDGLRQAGSLHEFAAGAAAQGGYAAVVTCLFAAEHLYRTWCSDAIRQHTLTDEPIRTWVQLHTVEPFLTGVDDLTDEVDALGQQVTDHTLSGWFTGMILAEIGFHHAVYKLAD